MVIGKGSGQQQGMGGHLLGGLGPSEEMSTVMQEIIRIHEHDQTEDRLIHHWIGSVPVGEEWEVQGAVANIIAAAIPTFIQGMRLDVHAVQGFRGSSARFRHIQCGDQDLRAPRDALFFLETTEGLLERFVLSIQTDINGGSEITVFAQNPSLWIRRLKSHTSATSFLRGKMFDLDGSVITPKDTTLEDVILTSRQRKVVDRHILGYARKLEQLKARGARGTRGILLEGKPGCGKSMLLRAIAHELQGVSICIAGAGQLSQRNSIETLRQLVEMTSPCMVFLEEIDIFGMDRHRAFNPALAELMQLMDGVSHSTGVLWVATTNRPEIVEQALADRPGRFDRRVRFSPLPRSERRELIQRLVRPQVINDDGLDLAVALTSGSTGAVIRELIETLRILSDEDSFNGAHITAAWKDCGFAKPARFGFAGAQTRHTRPVTRVDCQEVEAED